MLFTSPVFSQASGSVAGLVFSHGRSGMYTRSRSTPTNPDTARQRIIKTAMKRLAPIWGQVLTVTQRAAWDLYGSNVAMTNPLGATIYLTGQNHFMRTNVPRIQANLGILSVAPTIFDLGTYTAPVIVGAFEATQDFWIAFGGSDTWVNVPGGYMLVYMGRPVGPGRAYYGGPYRFAGVIVGDSPPPANPQDFAVTWPVNAGNLIWVMARIIQTDGRMSPPIILGPSTILFN